MEAAPGTVPATQRAAARCAAAVSPEELHEHFEIRRQVFVTEQGVFSHSDRDVFDDRPDTIHLVGWWDGAAAGAVRLFPVQDQPGIWQGDRLCVLRKFRVHGIGGPLVRCAVACAGARGGAEMIAHIQLPNVTFFSRLGWHRDGPVETYAGLPHQPMRIALPPSDVGQAQEYSFAQDQSAAPHTDS